MPADEESEVAASFTPIDSRGLEPIAVVAQCLDNQWSRADVLRRIVDERLPFEDRDEDTLS